MSRTLLARTYPNYYTRWAVAARRAGGTDEEVAKQVQTWIKEAHDLLAGKCPKCGAPVARYVDYEKQQGPSDVPGAWVQYRCSTAPPPGERRPDGVCDLMIDIREGEATN